MAKHLGMRRLVLAAVLTAAAVQAPLLQADDSGEPQATQLEPLPQLEQPAPVEVQAPAAQPAPVEVPAGPAPQPLPVEPPVEANPDDTTGPSDDRLSIGETVRDRSEPAVKPAQEPVEPEPPADGGEDDSGAADPDPVEPDGTTTTPEDVTDPDEEEFGVGFDDEEQTQQKDPDEPSSDAGGDSGGSSTPVATPTAAPVSSLPMTGADLAPFALLGFALILAGSALRGVTARQ